MLKLLLYCFIIISIASCKTKTANSNITKTITMQNGFTLENYQLSGKQRMALVFDSLGLLYSLLTSINDTTIEELNFNNDGRLFSKLIYNKPNILNGNGYFFYPSGSLKSMRVYRDNKYSIRGVDYYDYSGIDLRHIYYDSTGSYYYRTDFSDTSSYYEQFFNEKNPLSYMMIKTYCSEPTKSKLIKLIESIGLDSLKQIY